MKSTFFFAPGPGLLKRPAAGTLGTAGRLRTHRGAAEAVAGASLGKNREIFHNKLTVIRINYYYNNQGFSIK